MTMDRLPEGVMVDRRAHPRGFFGRCKTWLLRTKNVRNLEAVLGTCALAGGVVLTFYLVDAESDERRAEDVAALTFQSRLDAYQAELTAYTVTVTARENCLTSVAGSLANREQWELQAEYEERMIAAIANVGGERVTALAEELRMAASETIRNGPVLSRAPRSFDECPPEPSLPTPPTR